MEGVDVSDLHRVHALPEPGSRGPEVGDPGGDRDPRAGQRHGRARLADQLRELRRGPRRCLLKSHSPFHSGLRLPRKAEMPSFASAVWNAVANPAFSASMPSSRSPLWDTSLTDRKSVV